MTYKLTYTGDPTTDRLPGIPLGDLIVVTEAEAKALTSTGFYKRDGTGPEVAVPGKEGGYKIGNDLQAAVTRATTEITRDRAARAAEIRAARAAEKKADEPTAPPAEPPAEPGKE